LLLFDKLFDSLNGSFSKVIEGKIYRTDVTKNSVHYELWSDSLKVLSSMCFYTQNGKRVNVPTVRNWIITIKGMFIIIIYITQFKIFIKLNDIAQRNYDQL